MFPLKWVTMWISEASKEIKLARDPSTSHLGVDEIRRQYTYCRKVGIVR